MSAFLDVLEEKGIEKDCITRGRLTTLQVNLGNLCNQVCRHCHVDASPAGRNIMGKGVIEQVVEFLSRYSIGVLDITGGAPELNPNFEQLIFAARPLVEEVIVRSNLTVLVEEGKEDLPELFRTHKVHLICSLPCYTRENVDRQRGRGVFDKSIRTLKLLNRMGYARRDELKLDLVYNPLGGYLPGGQDGLERDYRKALFEGYGVKFNRLLTITNVPVSRFKTQLETRQEYARYTEILRDNFNPGTLPKLMCRSYLSVGYDGRLYDCDFNLAMGLPLKNADGSVMSIGNVRLKDLTGRAIQTGDHCLACTAGSGSSCQGALEKEQDV